LIQVKPTINENDLYSSLPYLLYDYQFSRHFSATSIIQHESTNTLNREITFGGFVPKYSFTSKGESSCESITPLKGNFESVKEIKSNFKKGDIFSPATLTQFENNLEKYDILHLSMHRCLNLNDPQRSSLIFTYETSQKPNLFYLGTLYNKTISAELIVLSACKTGGGKLRGGEGLMSFGRAFLYAGGKSVVMNLWDANPKASQIIMKSFYKNIVQPKMTKDKALTNALRDYAQSKFKHPSYWANYIITGDLTHLIINQK